MLKRLLFAAFIIAALSGCSDKEQKPPVPSTPPEPPAPVAGEQKPSEQARQTEPVKLIEPVKTVEPVKMAIPAQPAVYDKWPFDAAEAKRRQEETAKALGEPVGKEIDLGNGVKMKLALIPAGEFLMGSPATEEDHESDEFQHLVRLTKPFYMGATEVTNGQYRRFKPDHDSGSEDGLNDDVQPAVIVSRSGAAEFCKWLGRQSGMSVRLPTEAEWEYACRAGTATRFNAGNDDNALDAIGWYAENSEDKTHPVGQKKPNAWGLYDMHGNASEWCSDFFSESYFKESTVADPIGPAQGAKSLIRGGAWDDEEPGDFRSASRLGVKDSGDDTVGFRVVVASKSKAP
jgi:formylglycine-generating enzyme required for sulfatase activity